jgi:hypothetical protein
MENTNRAKQMLLAVVAVTALYLLPESTLIGAKRALEIMVVIQLCHEVFKRQK